MIWFDKLRIKILNWRAGNGFKMPNPSPKEYCLYNYCRSIANSEEIHKNVFYEEKIQKLIERCKGEITREDAAKLYMEALERVYGKENI